MNGRFDFLILHLLSKEKMYGFQIIKKLFDATDGEIDMKTERCIHCCKRWKIEVILP